MIIKKIDIDNYGKYAERSFDGLSQGVNVLFGPNEHGKTTLLEFVRRIFFGFPPGTYRKNRFEPANGSKPGGRLLCELDSGEELIIERSGWTKGGALKLNNVDADQRELSDLLRAGESFYQNVYGITIEELYDIQSLNGEDIKNRIYGAGLDLGGISLSQVKKQLQANADRIYKPGGHKHLIHALDEQRKAYEVQIKNGSESLQRYEEIVREEETLNREREVLREKIKKISGLNEFIDYENLYEKLKNIPETPAISEDEIGEFQEMAGELKAATARLAENRKKLLELEEKLKSIRINSALPELAPEISTLERSSERYRSDRLKVGELAEQIERLDREADDAEIHIASLWADGEVPGDFNFSLEFLSEINEFEQDFNDLRQKKITADALIQQHAQRKNMPGNLLSIIFIGILDLLMLAAGIVMNSFVIIVVAALLAVFAALAAAQSFSGDRDEQKSRPGPLEEKAAELEKHWTEFLEQHGFAETPTPRDLLNCAEIYKNFRKNRHELAALEKELESRQLWLTEIDRTFKKVAAAFDKKMPASDIVANIEIASSLFKENEKAVDEHKKLSAEMKKAEADIALLEEKAGSLEAVVQAMLERFKAKDLKDLRQMLSYCRERRNLNEEIEKSRKRLKNIFGLNSEIDEIRSRLENFSEGSAEDKEALERELTELNTRYGALQQERRGLVSGDKLTALQNELECCIQQIRDYASQWAGYRAAELLINRAVGKYEQERQPEVISRATGIFSRLTGGAYVKIRKPAESDELLLVGANGATRKVLELSRATREQLYLAMRLGLIEQYEEKTEKLPLVFDDILVNFDKTRLDSALAAIFEFARKRQVILLTCHQNIHSLLLKYGANDIK
jgi:uncharacterized protein YhaN